jgi:hypothetical protein
VDTSETPEDLPPLIDESDRRLAGRSRVLIGGIAVTRDGTRTWDCAVKNISPEGVQFRVSLEQVIPEHFIFINLKDGKAHQSVIQWIRPPLIGAKFLETYELEGLTDPKLQFVKRLWIERRRR